MYIQPKVQIIIGMSGRFPGATDIDAFWQNLRAGVESISFFEAAELLSVDPATLNKPNYVKAAGVLSDIERLERIYILELIFKIIQQKKINNIHLKNKYYEKA